MTLVLSLEHIEHLSRQERRESEEHPSPERLAAYHAGRLSEEEDATVREHLLLCHDCPALLLDLEELFEPRFRDLDLTEAKLAAAWRDLRARLVPDGGKGTPGGSTSSAWKRLIFWFSAVPRPVYAAAAGVMLLLTTWSLVRQPVARIQPDANPKSVMIEDISTRGGSETAADVHKIEFRAGHFSVPLVITLEIPPEVKEGVGAFAWFEARFQGEGGGTVESVKNLLASGRVVRMTIYRTSLKPGRYDLRLFGFRPGQRSEEPAGRYEVEVLHL